MNYDSDDIYIYALQGQSTTFFFVPSSKYPTFIIFFYIFIPQGISSRIFDIHDCGLSVLYLFKTTGTYFENIPKGVDIFFGLRGYVS